MAEPSSANWVEGVVSKRVLLSLFIVVYEGGGCLKTFVCVYVCVYGWITSLKKMRY
ncbi:hypothetical protein BC939DRAFT_466267, partial [Gamsiella multidivaricata]|uniref:uncharacterized protein n=1 Tax=Gamsiella multidivaricata TaxID=101098 RepID=UPI00221E3F49